MSLTVGELRSLISGLHDDCHVEVNTDHDGWTDEVEASVENDGDGFWLSINVQDFSKLTVKLIIDDNARNARI